MAIEQQLAVPELPDGWRSNDASLRQREADGVTAWYAGYLTPSDEYAGMYQGLAANPTWTAGLLENTLATGVVTIDGVEWTVYDNRETGADVEPLPVIRMFRPAATAGGSDSVNA